MLQDVNDAQLVWYQLQLMQDDMDNFEMLRDIAEYNSMFVNPEGVKKVREARENTNSYKTSDEDFEKMIEEKFGRKAGQKIEPKIKVDDYLEMELDEVKFVPYEE
jgi:hypothetical protein